jgi:hypothetical protein
MMGGKFSLYIGEIRNSYTSLAGKSAMTTVFWRADVVENLNANTELE